MNRRTFIKRSTLATAQLHPNQSSAICTKLEDKNRSYRQWWYGLVIARAALQTGGVEIAAVSDVDSEHLQNGIKELEALQESTSRAFKDYRDLLRCRGLKPCGSELMWDHKKEHYG